MSDIEQQLTDMGFTKASGPDDGVPLWRAGDHYRISLFIRSDHEFSIWVGGHNSRFPTLDEAIAWMAAQQLQGAS